MGFSRPWPAASPLPFLLNLHLRQTISCPPFLAAQALPAIPRQFPDDLCEIPGVDPDAALEKLRPQFPQGHAEELHGDAALPDPLRCRIAAVRDPAAHGGVVPASSEHGAHQARHGGRQGQRRAVPDEGRIDVVHGLAVQEDGLDPRLDVLVGQAQSIAQKCPDRAAGKDPERKPLLQQREKTGKPIRRHGYAQPALSTCIGLQLIPS
ncbi:MAG: hypothetical protein MZV70_51380 [Desulfobacterales bacterium]|nr:hypothetical protein [Desulfobacterales bacterium]